MEGKIQYTNSKGDAYFVRCVDGKKGKRYVCSKKESADDLISFPDDFEFCENPNGKVSFRRKLVSLIKPEEMELAARLTSKLAAPDLIKTELKKDEIVIYSHHCFPDLRPLMPCPGKSEHKMKSFLANIVHYEPVLKFRLTDENMRIFTAFRMTWLGKSDWMYLNMGSLPDLIEKYAPHIEKDSFFELF